MGRGRVHLKTLGQERSLSALGVQAGAGAAGPDPPRGQVHLLGNGADCVSLTDYCERPLSGGAETMAPPEGPRAPLEFGGPLGNGAARRDLGQRLSEGELEGVN